MEHLAIVILAIVILAFMWFETRHSRKEEHGGWQHHLNADPSLEWWGPQGQLTRAAGKNATKEAHGGWQHHLNADPTLEWWGPRGQLTRATSKNATKKEHYGEPPGMIRAVHQDELGFRGWADMPGDYEGSSAASVSAYIQRSA